MQGNLIGDFTPFDWWGFLGTSVREWGIDSSVATVHRSSKRRTGRGASRRRGCLSPLYEAVDPDALDTIFGASAGSDTVVEFDTDDVRVTLWGDDGVEIGIVGLSNE